jgi:DNA-binding GntR family transcriptional regulator
MPSNLAPISIQPQKLSDHAYDMLCNAIVEGELLPGKRLREAEMAEILGISRTPVREAFAKLGRQNLVEKGLNGAYYVATWDRQTLWEVATLRAALEGLAFNLASQNFAPEDFDYLQAIISNVDAAIHRQDYERLITLDIQFHSYVWSRAQHKLLEEMLEQMRPLVRYFMYLARPVDGQYTPESHRKLVEVLREGNSDKAMSIIHEHIVIAAERTIAQLEL